MTGGGSAADPGPPPDWTILVATIGERRDLLARLLDVLLPQTDPYGGRVKVLAYWNNGDPPLPDISQRLVEAATSEYVCRVDDDDLVAESYVADVMAALNQRPDYVGWLVQCYTNGKKTAVAEHSIRHRGWFARGGRLYRDLSHINPIRADLARRADFRKVKPGQPEDRAWVAQLRGLVQTEVFIDKIMYHYLWSTSKTAGTGSRWRKPGLVKADGYQPLPVDHPHFSYLDRR
jgi:hypothetical protein